MLLKYFSEKFLTKAIYFLTFILALTPGIYTNNVIYPYITGKTIAFRIIISIMLFLYITLVLKDKKYLPPKSNILACCFLFVFACIISGLISFDPVQSFWSSPERMMGTFNLAHFFLFALIISSVFKAKETWLKLINSWNILIVSTGTIALYTFVSRHITNNTSIFSNRFYGFAGNPIFFAAVILIFFYLNLYLFFEKLNNEKRGNKIWWHVAIAIMYILFIILTGSRGAFVALGVTGFVFLISLIVNPNNELDYLLKINVQRISLIFLITGLIGASAVFALKNTELIKNNYILRRLTSININDGASFSRIIVSKIGLNCFTQKPFFGYGFDNFEICYQQNFDKMIAEVLPKETRFDKTHNMPIEVLATTGIIGFAFFIGMYIFSYKNIRDLMLNNKINFYSGLSIILAIVAYFIQNLFVFDVFEGLIALCFVFGFIVFLSEAKSINIPVEKLNEKIKDILIVIVFVLLSLNVYWFSIYIFYHAGLVRRIDHLVVDGKTEKAIEIIKKIPEIKSPYTDAFYFGFFDIFIKNQKNISQELTDEYYRTAFANQQKSYFKYPYRTHIYLVQLAHIASKAINPEIKLDEQDVANATEIIELTKKYNLKQPELDFFYIQILLNSKEEKNWILGEKLVKESIDFYPESGKFYWIYGVHLIEIQKKPEEGVKYLKKSYEKEITFDAIDQLMTTVVNLNKYNEPDTAILFLNKYIPGNPTRFQLFMELARAYILKNDKENALKAINQAKKVYAQERFTRYSSKIEKELVILEEKINNMK